MACKEASSYTTLLENYTLATMHKMAGKQGSEAALGSAHQVTLPFTGQVDPPM